MHVENHLGHKLCISTHTPLFFCHGGDFPFMRFHLCQKGVSCFVLYICPCLHCLCVKMNKEHTHQHLLIYVGLCHPPCQASSVIYGRPFPKIMLTQFVRKSRLLCTVHLFMSLLLFYLCYLLVSSSLSCAQLCFMLHTVSYCCQSTIWSAF